MPFILGNEAAGTIVAVGKDSSFKIGDTVAAYTAGGAFAEYCIAQDSKTVKLPEGFTTREAATVLLQGLTALCFIKCAHSFP
jgi:NADPH2:quinone reductase